MSLVQPRISGTLVVAFILLALAPTHPLGALERIHMELIKVSGDSWSLQGAESGLQLTAQGLIFVARAESLAVAGEPRLRNLSLRCDAPEINSRYLVCLQGAAAFDLAAGGERLISTLDFVFRRSDGRWRATGDLALTQGRLAWRVEGDAGGIQVFANSERLEPGALLSWTQALYPQLAALSGQFQDLSLQLRLPDQGPVQGEFQFAGKQLGFDTEQGRVAAAGMDLAARGEFRAQSSGWRFNGKLDVHTGQVLVGSFYTRVEEHPVSLQLQGTFDADQGLTLDAFALNDADALKLTGSAHLDWSATELIQRLDLKLEQVLFPDFYQRYLQPLLAQSGFGNLTVQGTASGSLTMRQGELDRLLLELTKVKVTDAKQRLEFTDLDGRLSWQRGGPPTFSLLSWKQARVYQIGLGAVLWRVRSQGDDFTLVEPTTLPVLDGALQINSFEMENLLSEEPRLLFDAELEPVSLDVLTRTLGWPEMSGEISGRIPELTLEQGVYRLGGQLTVNVFDGIVRVANLRLERPFGVLPKLVADVEVDHLDLERITNVFTFGKIQGRLQGYVRKLRLLNWRPVHFDAVLATPPDSESEQRISQRAVETLSSLGAGGATGAMSGMFLRIFEDFGYRQLGLNCYLDDNVCLMGGVAPAPNGGYYIVEGSGIPRVDVIGYVERVDWPVLIDQLIMATQGNLPTVGRPDS